VWIVGWLELLSEVGTERAIVDGAANLEQQAGAASRSAHLLGFVHPAVHEEVGRPLSDRGADPQAGTVSLGVVDQPGGLAGQVAVGACNHRWPCSPLWRFLLTLVDSGGALMLTLCATEEASSQWHVHGAYFQGKSTGWPGSKNAKQGQKAHRCEDIR